LWLGRRALLKLLRVKHFHDKPGGAARVLAANKFDSLAFVTLVNGTDQSFCVDPRPSGPVFMRFSGGSGHRMVVIYVTLCW
jgi:hypothetical protein